MAIDPTCSSFFFNDTPTPEIYPLSLHDALPICALSTPTHATGTPGGAARGGGGTYGPAGDRGALDLDRKSTRLNSSHTVISYAVFCLKKKKEQQSKYSYREDLTCRLLHVELYCN